MCVAVLVARSPQIRANYQAAANSNCFEKDTLRALQLSTHRPIAACARVDAHQFKTSHPRDTAASTSRSEARWPPRVEVRHCACGMRSRCGGGHRAASQAGSRSEAASLWAVSSLQHSCSTHAPANPDPGATARAASQSCAPEIDAAALRWRKARTCIHRVGYAASGNDTTCGGRSCACVGDDRRANTGQWLPEGRSRDCKECIASAPTPLHEDARGTHMPNTTTSRASKFRFGSHRHALERRPHRAHQLDGAEARFVG